MAAVVVMIVEVSRCIAVVELVTVVAAELGGCIAIVTCKDS